MAHVQFVCIKLVLLFYFKVCRSQQVDYWSDDFDENKNCESEDEIVRLSGLKPSPCKQVVIKNEEEAAFRQCKTELFSNLQDWCEIEVLYAGQLLYCKDRQTIKCCYRNETCASWSDKKSKYEKAKEYLKNTSKFLEKELEYGYKTCNHLDSLDVGKCADDCKRMEEEKFAKNCTSSGGLFKCCISRYIRGCNECKFCCTLTMCTYKPGGRGDTYFDKLEKVELKDQDAQIKAHDFFLKLPTWCMKPYSHEDPQKWRTYEMDSYRQAFDLKTFDNIRTFKSYEYMSSFDDPKAFKLFTKNEKNGRKILKKAFGYYYSKSMPGHFGGNYSVNMTACIKKCIKMEKSKFALRCSRNGGFFKCCVTFIAWEPYETERNKLIKDGIVNGTQSHVCNRTSAKNPCLYCTVNPFCTSKNPFTGKITQLYYPNKKQPSKGRFAADIDKFRFRWCMVLDLCKYHSQNWGETHNYYANDAYLQAVNKDEVCAATNVPDEGRCSRMISGNIIQCSKEDESIANSKILLENKMLIRMIKTTKKKESQKNQKSKMPKRSKKKRKTKKKMKSKKNMKSKKKKKKRSKNKAKKKKRSKNTKKSKQNYRIRS